MNLAVLVLTVVVQLFAAVPVHADENELFLDAEMDANDLCSIYATDRNYTGDRKQRSLDVCSAAVDALVQTGDFVRADVVRDPYSHLNRVCGMNGRTFKQGAAIANNSFLNAFKANVVARGYTIYPNDYAAIHASLVEGKEADLFVPSNFSTVNCSSLLYVLFRVENYVRKI